MHLSLQDKISQTISQCKSKGLYCKLKINFVEYYIRRWSTLHQWCCLPAGNELTKAISCDLMSVLFLLITQHWAMNTTFPLCLPSAKCWQWNNAHVASSFNFANEGVQHMPSQNMLNWYIISNLKSLEELWLQTTICSIFFYMEPATKNFGGRDVLLHIKVGN